MHIVKVLILRFSSIGDIVLTSPVIRCLKNQVPGVDIHYATKKQFAGLVSHNPAISRVHLLGDSMTELIRELREENFDLVIDLHNNLRTLRIKWALGAKYSTYRKLNIRKWILVKFKKNLMPDRHIVHRYLDTCRRLKVVYDGYGLDFYPENNRLPAGIELPAVPFAVFAIGGTYFTKKMPLNKMQELAEKSTVPIVLIGDKHDAVRGAELAGKQAGVINLCGMLSIDESAAVMDRAAAVIAHDTGMMHIAAALKKKVISIWGNTIPAFGMYPFFPEGTRDGMNIISEVSGLSCRPCSKLGFDKCPKGHFHCMQLQDTDKIVQNLS